MYTSRSTTNVFCSISSISQYLMIISHARWVCNKNLDQLFWINSVIQLNIMFVCCGTEQDQNYVTLGLKSWMIEIIVFISLLVWWITCSCPPSSMAVYTWQSHYKAWIMAWYDMSCFILQFVIHVTCYDDEADPLVPITHNILWR